MATNFTKIIKDLKKAGWTQADIAKYAGVTDTYISLIARGVRNNPGYDLGRKLVSLHLQVKP